MNIREATFDDIGSMHRVRTSVKENVLSNPGRVTEADYRDYIGRRGKGWVCELDGQLIGFAIADLEDHNVWALFVQPGFEGKGIGRLLHDTMLDWYFRQTNTTIWLGTSPGTRAETFYRKSGWTEAGLHGSNETRFEMTAENWKMRMGVDTQLHS